MFHVTRRENVAEIHSQGLRAENPDGDWVVKRTEMRRLIDDIGTEMKDDWIPRTDGVFLWTTRQKALQHSERYINPAIVEVDAQGIDFYCVPNFAVEDLYEEYIQGGISDEEAESAIKQLVRMARLWNFQFDDGLELWTQGPIEPEYLSITDIEGKPIKE